MSRRLIVRALAERDLTDAAIWYEQRSPGLGRRFLAEADAAYANILDRPTSFPLDHRDTRRALLRRFPYAVYFILRDTDVVVLAVLHERQDKQRHLSRGE